MWWTDAVGMRSMSASVIPSPARRIGMMAMASFKSLPLKAPSGVLKRKRKRRVARALENFLRKRDLALLKIDRCTRRWTSPKSHPQKDHEIAQVHFHLQEQLAKQKAAGK